MKKFLGLLAALVAVGVILQLPDLQRSWKIRRM
ncbi:MAG: DUF6893 family small protein [Vicinamibacteria bacterium]